MEWLSVYARDQATMALVATAFPGSLEEESTPVEAFDTVENDQDRAMMGTPSSKKWSLME